MGKTDPFTQFYPTGFTQWVKLTVPTLMWVSQQTVSRHWRMKASTPVR